MNKPESVAINFPEDFNRIVLKEKHFEPAELKLEVRFDHSKLPDGYLTHTAKTTFLEHCEDPGQTIFFN